MQLHPHIRPFFVIDVLFCLRRWCLYSTTDVVSSARRPQLVKTIISVRVTRSLVGLLTGRRLMQTYVLSLCSCSFHIRNRVCGDSRQLTASGSNVKLIIMGTIGSFPKRSVSVCMRVYVCGCVSVFYSYLHICVLKYNIICYIVYLIYLNLILVYKCWYHGFNDVFTWIKSM